MNDKKYKRKKGEQLFWGIYFILAAVLIILSSLGLVQGMGLIRLLIGLLLLAGLVKSILTIEFTGILFSLAFLAILYSRELGLQEITPWPVLAAATLGSIGFNLLFKERRHMGRRESDGRENNPNGQHVYVGDDVVNEDGSSVGDSSSYYHVSFGERNIYVESQNFTKISLDCCFGAMKVYFEHAKIAGDSAEININNSFGGIELYIPRNWNVVSQASEVLGGIQEKNRPQTSGFPTVVITGRVSLAGVEIFYI